MGIVFEEPSRCDAKGRVTTEHYEEAMSLGCGLPSNSNDKGAGKKWSRDVSNTLPRARKIWLDSDYLLRKSQT
jgi:hypothetical protein